jgi:hypothetical protein
MEASLPEAEPLPKGLERESRTGRLLVSSAVFDPRVVTGTGFSGLTDCADHGTWRNRDLCN